jgi:cytochrome c oxidase accessory protein FixG
METNLEHKEAFRDSIATVDASGKRAWIYPQQPKGKLYNARSAVGIVCLALMFGIPFIKVDGVPLFLFNILERRFILFGFTFWPQDFFLLGLTMITFIVFIVLFTILFGRIWCGWTCPQTVFMEILFRRVEYWIEGDASHQKQLDKGPWNQEKIIKKGTKHLVFFAMSFVIANTFLAYIISIDKLWVIITEPVSLHIKGLTSILVLTGVFYGVYAYFREQVCIVVCPYGRLQGVLLDKKSVVVAYDYERGEPRGKIKKNELRTKGDCIDCFQCVKVCPTGIDIRNGTQLECINCTACIDVCNHMMNKVGLPKGLIRLDSEEGIQNKQPFKFTARIIGYCAVLFVLLGSLTYGFSSRTDIEATVLRTPGLLYQKYPDGHISNLYSVKLINKTHKNIPTKLKLEGLKGEIRMIGDSDLNVKKEDFASGGFFLIFNEATIKSRKTKVEIGVYSGSKKIATVKTIFMAPAH